MSYPAWAEGLGKYDYLSISVCSYLSFHFSFNWVSLFSHNLSVLYIIPFSPFQNLKKKIAYFFFLSNSLYSLYFSFTSFLFFSQLSHLFFFSRVHFFSFLILSFAFLFLLCFSFLDFYFSVHWILLFFKNSFCLPIIHPPLLFAQSAGAVEYTNCFSGEGWDSPQRVSWIWH